MVAVEFMQIVALEDAKQHWRQGLDGMLHFPHDAPLQADEIAGHEVVEYLSAAVRQQLVAERPAGQHRVEMGAVASLHENRGALVDRQFALLEGADEGQFLFLKLAENRQWPQGTILARILSAG